MSNYLKRRDGFEGEKIINVPQKLLKQAVAKHPALFALFITHIGYFPKALSHFRERKKGCDDNIFIYCTQGKGHFIIDDKKFEITANQFLLVPATDKYLRYWADSDDPWTIYWLHYRGSDLDEFNNSLKIRLHNGPIQIPFNQKALDIWSTIYQSLEMGYSIENLCNATFCLYHFLATFVFIDKHILIEEKGSSDIVADAILYMKSEINKKLSVEDISGKYNLSGSHFSSLFRKNTGMSPIDYFIHLKMQKACQLLYASDDKIKIVALQLGYDDQYYFSRTFKKQMGISPEQYRVTTKKMT
ncbi:AraC family transcriptional regulator [Pedobacter sp. SL55]|uniref:AraC family transcriptional regulator n=1 Tax=Pedobacter sp. SL55 TaxID=2995161 RepID=UPI00226ECEDB|nr:AraC family transcriptional regulator [Pedobacter sp. SL55]WAC39786.1 AraC family transcriptional regulator [Pedobacter sp. SL55]